jgi:hypothetical protein
VLELPRGWADTAKTTKDPSELGNILYATDPLLNILRRGVSSTTMASPFIMCCISNKLTSGLDHICDSLKGGGQGNALTGQVFV